MTTIRVDTEVVGALEKRIRSFSDSPNSVLRGILGLEELTPVSEDLGRASNPIPQQAKFKRGRRLGSSKGRRRELMFRRPILEALIAAGGSADAADVLTSVERRISDRLSPGDYETLKSGDLRWRKGANFERYNMAGEGLLDPSPRGVWRISERGRAWLLNGAESTAGSETAFGLSRPANLDLDKARKLMDKFVEDNIGWLKEMAQR